MSKTIEFLKEAFAGESQANRKYTAFAAKADKEGFAQAAKLFRAAAEAEAIHANNHLRAQKAIKSTQENLQDAIAGEDDEWEKMYPGMIQTAKAEGNKSAEISFHYADEVEKIHSGLYRKVLGSLGTSEESFPYYVCPICGNTVEKEAPAGCPICETSGKLFKRID
jgi:rubrerythrin